MAIVQSLIEVARVRGAGQKLLRVTVGLGYCAVTLSDGRTGLGYIFRNSLGPDCSLLAKAGLLEETPVEEIVGWAEDENPLTAALGVAAINALADQDEVSASPKAGDELFRFSPEDKIGMIGYFGPLVQKAKEGEAQVYVFDSQRPDLPDVYPDEEQVRYLPTCTKMIITGTTIINHSLEKLITLGSQATDIVLLGFSTPLYPRVFAETPVTVLGGSLVPQAIYSDIHKIVGQAGGGKNLGRKVQKVNLRVGRGN